MEGDRDIVAMLNDALTAELTAVNQYFLAAKLCHHWGYTKLAARVREDSIDEMRDAERLIDRILELDGFPNLQRLGTVAAPESVPEHLALALETERAAVARYRAGVALASEHGDAGTAVLLEELLGDEEEHLVWLERQHRLLEQLGEALYLASWVG